MGDQQLGFSDDEQTIARKQTRRGKFLAEMEAVVPLQELRELSEPHYPKTSRKGGRPAYPLATMLRIHLLQQWYSLSDPAMEAVLIEVPSMHRFTGIDLMSDRIPGETTILTFRHLFEKHGLGEQIFESVKAQPSTGWRTMRQGTIVPAPLIAATSSTRNKDGKSDPEMHQTKKGNQGSHRFAEGFAYGRKVHLGMDKDSGLIHSVATTAADVQDLTPAAELRHGDEEEVVGGEAAGFCEAVAGCQGIARRPEMESPSAEFRVAMRPGKRRAIPDTPDGRLKDLIEAAKAPVRAKVESPFRVIKQQFGFQKTRLRGMAKNRCKVHMIASLTHRFLARRLLLAAT